NFFREAHSDVKNVEYVIAPVVPNVDKNKPVVEEKGTQNTTQKNELPLKDHYIDLHDNLNPKYIFESFVVGSFNELAYASAQAVIKKPAVY
ncbi:DnaA ATPase domain-containing protein, partial [Staphylococcus pasteuri_A]